MNYRCINCDAKFQANGNPTMIYTCHCGISQTLDGKEVEIEEEKTNSISEITFEEMKKCFRQCTTKMLMFIIMLANGELMDRCDKDTLTKKE